MRCCRPMAWRCARVSSGGWRYRCSARQRSWYLRLGSSQDLPSTWGQLIHVDALRNQCHLWSAELRDREATDATPRRFFHFGLAGGQFTNRQAASTTASETPRKRSAHRIGPAVLSGIRGTLWMGRRWPAGGIWGGHLIFGVAPRPLPLPRDAPHLAPADPATASPGSARRIATLAEHSAEHPAPPPARPTPPSAVKRSAMPTFGRNPPGCVGHG